MDDFITRRQVQGFVGAVIVSLGLWSLIVIVVAQLLR